MRAQARLRAPRRNATQRPQHARQPQQPHPHHTRLGQRGREAVQHHGRIVEDVRCQSVHLALGFQGCAESVREDYCRDAAHAVLDYREQEGGGRGG